MNLNRSSRATDVVSVFRVHDDVRVITPSVSILRLSFLLSGIFDRTSRLDDMDVDGGGCYGD